MNTHGTHLSIVSRRRFLCATATAGAAVSMVPAHVLGAAGAQPPSGRLALAGVGVGGVGFGQLDACAKAGFQIVALCDVDDAYAKKAYDKWPQARRYRDFRELFSAEGDKIDAVYIGTPDHTHALITLAALRRKKHVCCVKPLTRTVRELQAVQAEARKAGTATQVTALPHTSEAGCRTCELIWAGAIGPVREVHVWSNRPLWPQGMTRPPGQDPIPAGFDWKLWIGPAPMREFKKDWPDDHYALAQVKPAGNKKPWYSSVYHPFNFRGWWDFGTGALGDMGCHYFNTPFRALKLVHPLAVQATATKLMPESAPLASIVAYDFPARDTFPPLRAVWYDGGLKPPAPRELGGQPLPEEGVLYVGDEGKMLNERILSEERARKFASVPKTLPRRSGTWGEWADACKGGEPAGCNFDWAGPLTQIVLLGNIAVRLERRLEWNGAEMKFTHSDAANQLLHAPYQNGWSLDSV